MLKRANLYMSNLKLLLFLTRLVLVATVWLLKEDMDNR
jgi:hypothetical protein